MKNPIQKIPTVAEFLAAFEKIGDCIMQVCEMFVLMADHDPKVYDEIIKANPQMSYNLLGNLYRVGKGKLYHGLLFDSSPGAKMLLPLPPEQQKVVYETPVKVATLVRGKEVPVEKRVSQLSRTEAKLALNPNGLPRPIEAQVQILRAISQPPTQPAQRYMIVGEFVDVMEKTRLDRATLRYLLEQTESNALKGLEGSMQKNQVKR